MQHVKATELRAIVNGLSDKQISAKLGIGSSIAKWRVGNLLSKTGMLNRTVPAVKAVQVNPFNFDRNGGFAPHGER